MGKVYNKSGPKHDNVIGDIYQCERNSMRQNNHFCSYANKLKYKAC